MSTAVRPANRLIHEKSPYLLQHAHNPVDWYPWGEEAFAKARREDKPVFLSIGYSTCHWCHVMERESFEDDEVAEVLNRHFVAVKVDREERPDVDQVYMEVCQALTGQGGWPLTILLTPEKHPFFAGTYFPKRSRGGLPGLLDLLVRVAEGWRRDRARFNAAGEELVRSLGAARREFPAPAGLTSGTLDAAYASLARAFDPLYGGFGSAPKFPLPHRLLFLLRCHRRTGEAQARQMVEKTLDGMWRGGLWDHVGFGFARYSTDRRWLVPHFEKMLYDNALLALAYLEAHQATGEERWARVTEQIFAYVLREMTSPEGGFYSAQDADSEGVEGKFYVWTPTEVEAVLGRELAFIYCRCYAITPEGNFEGKSIPNLIGRNWDELAAESGLTVDRLAERLEEARVRLFAARQKRVPPHKDDKVLTGWNGLMIAALARGAAALQKPAYAASAWRAAEFLLANLRRTDGRLLARYRAGEAAYPAYLDDYAFLAWGLLELYQATFVPAWLQEARRLLDDLRRLFWDETDGGFFFTGRDGEELLFRPKDAYDGALPSGNSVAALALQRLAHLTGDPDPADLSRRQLAAFAGQVAQNPASHTFFLLAMEWAVEPVTDVVVAGDPEREETRAMLQLLHRAYLPLASVRLEPRPGERPVARLCRGTACQAPVASAAELAARLDLIQSGTVE